MYLVDGIKNDSLRIMIYQKNLETVKHYMHVGELVDDEKMIK
jgi:hypothetical protein